MSDGVVMDLLSSQSAEKAEEVKTSNYLAYLINVNALSIHTNPLALLTLQPQPELHPIPVYTLSNGATPSKKIILYHKYFGILHQTNTIVFIIISPIKRTNFHLPSTITSRISLFLHVMYSCTGLQISRSYVTLLQKLTLVITAGNLTAT